MDSNYNRTFSQCLPPSFLWFEWFLPTFSFVLQLEFEDDFNELEGTIWVVGKIEKAKLEIASCELTSSGP